MAKRSISCIIPLFLTGRSKNYRQLVETVETKMIKIYSIAYRYQIRIVLQCTRTKPHQLLRNLVRADNWKEMQQDVNKENDEINEAIRDLSTSRSYAKPQNIEQVLAPEVQNMKSLHRQMLHEVEQEVSEQGRCLQGTQRDALAEIQSWVEDSDGKLVVWLRGMAGTGKSCIARTVAEGLNNGTSFAHEGQLSRSTVLGATFFLSHDDPSRSDISTVVPTLSVTLAQRIPALRQYISNAVRDDMKISTKNLSQQISRLILEPLTSLSKSLPLPIRLIIVIDALNEVSKSSGVRTMLKLFPRLQDLGQVNVRLLVVSRLEVEIPEELSTQIVHFLPLEKISRKTLGNEPDDIARFMRHELSGFLDVQAVWISQGEMEQLVMKCDGLFIYAATACRFLLGAKEMKRKLCARVQKIIKGNTDSISPEAMVFEPVSLETLSRLVDMKKAEVAAELKQLNFIVHVPMQESSHLAFFHLSFRDYLISRDRCDAQLWINEAQMHQSLFGACLSIMEGSLRQDMLDVPLPGSRRSEVLENKVKQHIPSHLRYSCIYWAHHLAKIEPAQLMEAGLKDNGAVHDFFQKYLLFWLEALSWINQMPRSISIIDSLQKLVVQNDSPLLSETLRDARYFSLNNRHVIEQAPLQTYYSALLSSPMKSISQDGSTIISGSRDKTLRVWDTVTGSEKLKHIEQGAMTAVFLAPDVRDIGTGEGFTLKAQGYKPRFTTVWDALSFSPDQNSLTSASTDLAVIWDIQKRESLQFMELHSDGICWRPIICLNSKEVAVVRNEARCYAIWLHRISTNEQIKVGQRDDLRLGFAFSKDGKKIALHMGAKFQIFDIASGAIEHEIESNAKVWDLEFSPIDSSLLAMSTDDGHITIYKMTSKATTRFVVTKDGLPSPTERLCFASNGRSLALASSEYIIGVWDVTMDPVHARIEANDSGLLPDSLILPEDERKVVVPFGQSPSPWSSVRSMSLGSLDTGNATMTDDLKGMFFSPNRKLVALTFKGPCIQVWNGTITRMITSFDHLCHEVYFSQDSQLIALAYEHGCLILDTTTWAERATLVTEGRTGNLQFSSSNQIVGLCSGQSGHIRFVAFNAYGSFVAIALDNDDETCQATAIDVCETSTGTRIHRFSRGNDSLNYGFGGLDFSTGDIMAYGTDFHSTTTTVEIWNGETGVRKGKHQVDVGHELKLSLSERGTHAITERGRVPLPLRNAYTPTNGLPKGTENCLSIQYGNTGSSKGSETLPDFLQPIVGISFLVWSSGMYRV
ncbi:hypothetical protein B0T10DRAFT_467339 [Thelonectria olida]|uniref:Nephrocystin 3-like N-terminal domain-containing protein n=1 Tax=Thelonectria olida TaxID=1576542 RepID=A0A9P8VPA5_9HYPO|nr:hypothetical protein B0T10DRAFT_467339 [Thelonectria olida]